MIGKLSQKRGLTIRQLKLTASVFIISAACAAALGIFVPTRWQLPTISLLGIMAGLYVAAITVKSIKLQRRTQATFQKTVADELADLREKIGKHSYSSAKTVESMLATMEKSSQLLSVLASRAHNDETRIREVAQLAKSAATNSFTLLSNLEQFEKSMAPTSGRILRPAASSVAGTGGIKEIGRQAAAVASDVDRPNKLLQALTYTSDLVKAGPMRIAIIGSPALQEYLSKAGVGQDIIMPSVGAAMLPSSDASIFVVEERGFSEGPWAGASSPAGTSLFKELESLRAIAKKNDMQTFLIANARRPDVYSARIREMLDYKFPSPDFEASWSFGAELGIMRLLQEYALQEWR